MSTEHQQYSPENQLDIIRQYAADHNMEIIHVYSDLETGPDGMLRSPRQSLYRSHPSSESHGCNQTIPGQPSIPSHLERLLSGQRLFGIAEDRYIRKEPNRNGLAAV
jgi:hypothetical protein